MEGLFPNLLQNIKEVVLAPHRDLGGYPLCGKVNTEKVSLENKSQFKNILYMQSTHFFR